MEMYMGQAPKYFNKDVVYCIWCVVNLSVPCKKKREKKKNLTLIPPFETMD